MADMGTTPSGGSNFLTRSIVGGVPNWALIGLGVAVAYIGYQIISARKGASTASTTPDNTTPPVIFQLPQGVYALPTPAGTTTPTGGTTGTSSVYPGVPRPDQTKVYTAVAGDTWSSIMNKFFPSGSTNPAALKEWHSTHGGNSAIAGWFNIPAGTKIYLPAHAGAFETPGHLSVNGNPNA